GKDLLLAFLSVVTLYDPYTAQRLGESARDLSVDLWPGTKNRANGGESFVQTESEGKKNCRGQNGHKHADPKQHYQRKKSGHDASGKFDQPCANQIANSFDVAHDARDQRTSLVGIVEGHRQPADVCLHLTPHLGNHSLRGFREQLGERERSKTLND